MGEKPKSKFALGDYVEVSERIAAWFEAYPDGRIETDIVNMTDKLVVTKSRCYRSADITEAPAGIGHSMLSIPGRTPYTKDSELENCETSSVGRALVMAGIPSKGIASGHEIRSKRAEPEKTPVKQAVDSLAAEHGAETGDALAKRQAAEDALIVDILKRVKDNADYPEAFGNLVKEIGEENDKGSGRLRNMIKTQVRPEVLKVLEARKQPAEGSKA
jgi:hypothetical protein